MGRMLATARLRTVSAVNAQTYLNCYNLSTAKPVASQRSQKGDWVIKKCVLVERKKIRKMISTEGKKLAEYLYGGQNNGTF